MHMTREGEAAQGRATREHSRKRVGPLALWLAARVHCSAMPRLLSPRVHSLSLLFLAAGLVACASDDAIKDQASGDIDKSPAKWSEPGAKADPPVVRDAGLLDPCDAGGALVDPLRLTPQFDSVCTVTISDGPATLDVRYLSVSLDNLPLSPTASDGYRLVGKVLTLVGEPCEKLMDSAPKDAGSDAGSDAGTDAGSDAGTDAGRDASLDASQEGSVHIIDVRYGSCVNP